MPPSHLRLLAGLPGIRPALHTPGGSGWAAQGGQALGPPPQELPSASLVSTLLCLGWQLWVLSLFMYTHRPGTASLDTLRPFQPGLRPSRLLPLCTRAPALRASGLVSFAPAASRGRPGLLGGLCTPGRLSPRKAGLRCWPRSGGDQTATRRRPELGQNAGTRAAGRAPGVFQLPSQTSQPSKAAGLPSRSREENLLLLKNRFPVLTRGM